ncbi:MAG: L-rhamnose mutarotase [Proteiniphilum sp.]|nr:L-rhamnose mutarotase [Proteiniphilum sp.]
MQRHGQIIGISKENIEAYKKHHAEIWPEITDMIRKCNIRNYIIYHYGELLFAQFEYVGNDFEGDMAKMAADPKTQEWWAIQKPLQRTLPDRREGEWWAEMEEVFHMD